MAVYNVTIEARATVADESKSITVKYEAEDYHQAWVGARTVCRMGSHPSLRIFRDEEGEALKIQAGVWTVRKIFVEGTRKKGKQRMTSLTADQLLELIDNRNIRMSKELRRTLTEVIDGGGSEGLRITVAAARRLGLLSEDAEEEEEGEELARVGNE